MSLVVSVGRAVRQGWTSAQTLRQEACGGRPETTEAGVETGRHRAGGDEV